MSYHLRDLKAIGISLSNRVAYAFLFSAVSFGLYVFPLGLNLEVAGAVAKLLNLPVALAGLVLPLELRGLDMWFQRSAVNTADPTQTLMSHLRNSIPIYVFLSYLPAFGRAGRDWLRRRRQHRPSDPLAALRR